MKYAKTIAPWLIGSLLTIGSGTLTAACKDVDLGGPHAGPSDGGGGDENDGAVVGQNTCGVTTENDSPLVATNKIDILLAVDNSAGMGDKAEIFAKAAKQLVLRLAPGRDVHVGALTSSLGGNGGDVCADSGEYVGDSASGLHLSARGADGVDVAPSGFLSFNGVGDTSNPPLDTFADSVSSLVGGVGESGCGLENQLESVYRFLIEPDPWRSVAKDATGRAHYDGTDEQVLAQRAAFLRPDSLVLVVLLTDEEDGSIDPTSIGGQGWAFVTNTFPGSPVARSDGKSSTAPRGTSVCATDPLSPDCTSCAFARSCDATTEACLRIRNDVNCQANGGYYGSDDDSLNVRFFDMKERFGVDPRFPVSRYVDGFTKRHIPSRDGSKTNCTNPLFAASLPADASGDTCCLAEGTRSRELVMFTTISGIVPSLVTNGRPDWDKAVGRAPENLDYTGMDPHMRSSIAPREGLAAPSSVHGDNGPDPVHGREWDTKKNDLQYACTFELATPRECNAANAGSCYCGRQDLSPPLCDSGINQTRAKAYPAIRPLLVAKGLSDRAVVGSVCPTDLERGYLDTVDAIESRALSRLTP